MRHDNCDYCIETDKVWFEQRGGNQSVFEVFGPVSANFGLTRGYEWKI